MKYPYKDGQEILKYWNNDVSVSNSQRGKYVAISGNTGSGKSTLIRIIRDKAEQAAINAIDIDERALHHPLLVLMFHFPKEYGLLIQLNFLVQRHLMLYRWLNIGYTVVMERSHLDDKLFVDNLLDERCITEEEYEAYVRLANVLDNKIPEPDIYVYLDVKPEVSIRRLKISEEEGERPKEFPDEKTKLSFVSSWYQRYNTLYSKLVAEKRDGVGFGNTHFLQWDAETDVDFMASEVIKLLKLLSMQ